MTSILRTLVVLHLREVLRSGIQSGSPRLRLRHFVRPVAVAGFLAFFSVTAFRLAQAWVSEHASITRTLAVSLLQPTLSTLSSGVAIVIIFYAFSRLIGRFTDGGDLPLLLVAPISPAVILGERILATALAFVPLLLVVVPALFAVGSGLGAAPVYYPAVVAGLLLLPVAPTSIASLLLIAVMSRLPPARARTISLLMGTGMSIAFFLTSRALAGGGIGIHPGLPTWLPSTWPGRFVASLALGDGGLALSYGSSMTVLALGLFAAATLVAGRTLATGSASYHEARSGRKSKSTVSVSQFEGDGVRIGRISKARRPAWWAIVVKDATTVRRDPQRLLALAYPLAIVGFNVAQTLSGDTFGSHVVRTVSALSLLILAAMLLANSTVPGLVNGEGRSLFLFALAPIPLRTVVFSKWFVAGVAPLAIVEIALVGLAVYLRLDPGRVVLLVLIFGALVVALCGLSIAINIAAPRLQGAGFRGQSSVRAVAIGFLCEGIVCAATGVSVVLGLFVWDGPRAGIVIAILLAGLLSLTAGLTRLTPRLLARLLRSETLLRGSS